MSVPSNLRVFISFRPSCFLTFINFFFSLLFLIDCIFFYSNLEKQTKELLICLLYRLLCWSLFSCPVEIQVCSLLLFSLLFFKTLFFPHLALWSLTVGLIISVVSSFSFSLNTVTIFVFLALSSYLETSPLVLENIAVKGFLGLSCPQFSSYFILSPALTSSPLLF